MSMNSGPCRGSSLPVGHRASRMNSNHNEPRVRSVTDLPSVTSPKHPEPFVSIPAQVLVEDNCRVHCGMVRKENRFNKWQDRYLVLHKGCLYYYKDSTDKVSQGQFSLSGYRLSTAPEKTKYEWTFKLIHIQPEKKKYYFSAHSQKELTEWLDKITEDMLEYCESVGQTRSPGYTPEPIQDIYPSNGSCSSNSGSGEDDKDYDYITVNPPSFDQIREQLKMDSSIASHIFGTGNPEDDETYHPPPAEFLQELNSSLPKAASRMAFTSTTVIQQTEHKNVTITGAGKASVDVSAFLKRDNTLRESVTPSSKTPVVPPRPTPRKISTQTPTQNRVPANCTSEAFPDNRPKVPPRPGPPPKPLPKPPTADVSPMLAAARPTDEPCEEDSEEYLKIIPDDDEPVSTPTNRSTLERMRPDGKSFKERPSETAQCRAEDVLPDSAKRNDLNKTEAIPLLLGREGMYMIHSSRGGDIKKCLSVCTGPKVKHFLIFRNTEGYALDPHGPRFKTKRNMLVYYHGNPLPNQENDAKLVQPYT